MKKRKTTRCVFSYVVKYDLKIKLLNHIFMIVSFCRIVLFLRVFNKKTRFYETGFSEYDD
jgi:hypothetical protein